MAKLIFEALDKYHNEVRPVEEIRWQYGEIKEITLDTYTFFPEDFHMIELRQIKNDGYKIIKI
jgi:hypothetical protein